MSELTIGIDEAGRGPILGPMVLGAVALGEEEAAHLCALGVMDSKRFGPGEKGHERRRALCPEILRVAAYVAVRVVDVAEIDRRAGRGELNRLEQEEALVLLGEGPPAGRIVADGARLFAPLMARYPQLEARDGGEGVHVAVAAASILAKVRRDEIWHKIARRYEPDFGDQVWRGGGYVNEGTRRFLRAYCARHRAPPPEGRRSWPWTFVADLLAPEQADLLRPGGQMALSF